MFKKLYALFLLLAMLLCSLPAAAQKDRQLTQDDDDRSPNRTALVIGNSDYLKARKLTNPVNDAADMTQGFDRGRV